MFKIDLDFFMSLFFGDIFDLLLGGGKIVVMFGGIEVFFCIVAVVGSIVFLNFKFI